MKVALASPHFPTSISDGLFQLEELIKDAVKENAEIICFPESFIPGYPALEFVVEKCNADALKDALNKACELAGNILSR